MTTYRIQNTTWAQEPLIYEDLLRVMEILKGHFAGFLASQTVLGELIDRLAKEQVLPRLIAILIRPHARTSIGRHLNERRMRQQGLTRENICTRMTVQEITKVLLDFFVFNVSWIQSLIPSATASIGTGAAGILQAEGILSRLKKLSLTWREATFGSPTTTESKTP